MSDTPKADFSNGQYYSEYMVTLGWSCLNFLGPRNMIQLLQKKTPYDKALFYQTQIPSHLTRAAQPSPLLKEDITGEVISNQSDDTIKITSTINQDEPVQNKKICSLTIDDAPGDPEMMKQLLKHLKHHNVKATFFIISDHVQYPDRHQILQQIVADGHQLGNHMTKDQSYQYADADTFLKDLEECEKVLSKYDPNWHSRGKWFRPPCGRLSPVMIPILEAKQYRIALGDVYPMDVGAQCFPAWISEFVVQQVQEGSVIILHCPDEKKKRPFGAQSVKDVISRLESTYRIVDLSDLFNSF